MPQVLLHIGLGLHGTQPQRNVYVVGQWRPMLLIPALRGQRQADLCEFEASLVYKASFRTARVKQ